MKRYMIKRMSSTMLFAVIVMNLLNSSVCAFGASPMFTDIKGHWAEASIIKMAEAGLASGNPDGSFEPDSDITRAEFVAMLCRALGKDLSSYADAYTDVSENDWYSKYAQYAKENGYILREMSRDGLFHGEQPVTREEAAVMCMLAQPVKWSGEVNTTLFEDHGELSEWARRYIAPALETGYITGTSGTTLEPKQYITRAQAVTIIERVIEAKERIGEDPLYNAQNPDNKIINDLTDKSHFTYSIKSVTRENGGAEGTVEHLEGEGSTPEDGCVFYNLSWSGVKIVNALQMTYELHEDNAIENGKIYKVGFKAKLVDDEPAQKSIKVNVVKFRDINDNNIVWSNEVESFTIEESDRWINYQVNLTANTTQRDVKLIYQLGGDSMTNVRLYIDDFYWIETDEKSKTQISTDEIDTSVVPCEGTAAGDVKISVDGNRLSAAATPGSDVLIDYWQDPYGNKITPDSVYETPAKRSYTYKTYFKEYRHPGGGFEVPVSAGAEVRVTTPVITKASAMSTAKITLPENCKLLEGGILFYPGYWTENFNVFSEDAIKVSADCVSPDGEFSASAIINTRYGVLTRAYGIYCDEEGYVFVKYSDTEYMHSKSRPEKIEHHGIIYHELLGIFTAETENSTEAFARFIDELAPTGADIVTVTPSQWKFNTWNSKVDGYWTDAALYEGTKNVNYYEEAKDYILSGGDPIEDTIEGIRRNDMYIFIDQRMNDHHWSDDLEWATHSYFWKNHPEYWLVDSDEYSPNPSSNLSRLFNYMIPEVREYFYSLVEELVTNYDVDGVQLDFDRYPIFFHTHEAEMGMDVMTEFVGRIREMVNRVSIDRGKDIQISVRLEDYVDEVNGLGLDIAEWCRRDYVDIMNVGQFYDNHLYVDIEGFKEVAKNAKVFGELHYLTDQMATNMFERRHITEQISYATAKSFYDRGADGISLFNMQYIPNCDILYTKFPVLFDREDLDKAEKNYVFTRGHGPMGGKDDLDFTFKITETLENFSSVVARVEYQKDATKTETSFRLNDTELKQIEREETEFFEPYSTNTAYASPEQVKFYEIPLDVIKNGENHFVIDTVTNGGSGYVQCIQMAFYH